MSHTHGWRVLPITLALAVQVGCSVAPPAPARRQDTPTVPAMREGPEYARLWLAVRPGGELYSVMVETDPTRMRVLFRRSGDFGASWQSPTVLTEITDPKMTLSFPWIGLDRKQGVYVIWRQKRGGSKTIYFTRSLDGGRTWQDQPTVLAERGQPFAPASWVDPDGRLYVLWQNERRATRDLTFTQSADSGSTWLMEPVDLTTELPNRARIYSRRLAADQSGRVYVTWYERHKASSPYVRRIALNRSANFGNSWLTQPVTIRGFSDQGYVDMRDPFPVVADNGHIYVGWTEVGWNVTPSLMLARSTDGGATWSREPIRLNTTLDLTAHPEKLRVAADGKGRVYALWTERTEDREWLVFRRSTDYGETWSPIRHLEGETPAGAFSDTPWIAADPEGRVFVVWQHWRRRTRGWRILFTRSDDSGATWLPSPVRLDTLPQSAKGPRAIQFHADRQGAIYVAWRSDPFGKQDYFLNRTRDYGTTWLAREEWITDPASLQSRQAEGATQRR